MKYNKGTIVFMKSRGHSKKKIPFVEPSLKSAMESRIGNSNRWTEKKLLKNKIIMEMDNNSCAYTPLFLALDRILSKEELSFCQDIIDDYEKLSEEEKQRKEEEEFDFAPDFSKIFDDHKAALDLWMNEYSLAVQNKDTEKIESLNGLINFYGKYKPRLGATWDCADIHLQSIREIMKGNTTLKLSYFGEEWNALRSILGDLAFEYQEIPTKAKVRKRWIEKYENATEEELRPFQTIAENMKDDLSSACTKMNDLLGRWGFKWLPTGLAGRPPKTKKIIGKR